MEEKSFLLDELYKTLKKEDGSICVNENVTKFNSALTVNKYLARKEYEKPQNKKYLDLNEVELLYSKGKLNEMHESKLLFESKDRLKIEAEILDKGYCKILDRVKILDLKEKYVELTNFSTSKTEIKISNQLFKKYKDFFVGVGVYGIITLEKNLDNKAEIFISEIEILEGMKPLEYFDMIIKERENMTTVEWLDLIIRSIGFNPDKLLFWEKIFHIIRLISVCEANYNLIELGPTEIGKTTTYEMLTPNCKILNGRATPTNIFYNAKEKKEIGYIKKHDVLVFDEIDKIKFQEPEVITILLPYMESGKFTVKIEGKADTSIVFIGNIKDPIEKMKANDKSVVDELKSNISNEAFLTRFNFFIPSWGSRKISKDYFIGENKEALRLDVLRHFLEIMRNRNYHSEILKDDYKLKTSKGKSVSSRDSKSIEKTVSGLLKILHPHKKVDESEIMSYFHIAFKGRKLVKRMLVKKNPKEFNVEEYQVLKNDFIQDANTSFLSYINRIEKKPVGMKYFHFPHRIFQILDQNKIFKYPLDSIGLEKNNYEMNTFPNICIRHKEYEEIMDMNSITLAINDCFIDYDSLQIEDLFGDTNISLDKIIDYTKLDLSSVYPYKKNMNFINRQEIFETDCYSCNTLYKNYDFTLKKYRCPSCGKTMTSTEMKQKLKKHDLI